MAHLDDHKAETLAFAVESRIEIRSSERVDLEGACLVQGGLIAAIAFDGARLNPPRIGCRPDATAGDTGMWPFKKRIKSKPNEVPTSPLSDSEAPLSDFDPRIDFEQSLERFDPEETPGEKGGYDGD